MLSYIEFCAGGGGMRAGLDAAGWKCVQAIDNDPDAIAVHRLAHGDALLGDVTELAPHALPNADAWVAGFPCQPFSTSGNRLGFTHRSGHVFQHLARLVAERQPRLLLLENVEGLLANKSGHTMAMILESLTRLGYEVSWLSVDLRWFGAPQTRSRLFIVAARPNTLRSSALPIDAPAPPEADVSEPNSFSSFIVLMGLALRTRSGGLTAQLAESLRPAVGKAQPGGRCVFGPCGHARLDRYESFDLKLAQSPQLGVGLGDIVAPSFRHRHELRSGRFYARGGPTRLCLRTDPVSHCVGTSLGGAPLFAVSRELVRHKKDQASFLEFANWHREQDGLLVMRLCPSRAVLLFGPHTERLYSAISEWEAGDTRKYKVVGNMVAPICAKAIADLINRQWVPAVSADYRCLPA